MDLIALYCCITLSLSTLWCWRYGGEM